jgi:hypothetical protein
MKISLQFLFFLAALAASSVHAQVLYKCVDAKGKTQYSDKQQAGCKKEKEIATGPATQNTAQPQVAPGSRQASVRDDECRRLNAEYNKLNRAIGTEESEARMAQMRQQVKACN